MKYAVVIRNVTDLRAEPKFRSERKSQLLFNEAVEILGERDGYCQIRQQDRYEGWADRRALHIVTKKLFRLHTAHLNYQVESPMARVKPPPGARHFPPFLFYGTRLNLVERVGREAFIMTHDNHLLRIMARELIPLLEENAIIASPKNIISDARRFLGVPYLWGGITPFGFDCSGLVQMVYRTAGIRLPRDSKDQRFSGHWINIDQVRKGDLRFFKGHVAIALDRYHIIHSSLAEGGVAVNSLNPGDPDFRPDLIDIFLEDRRVII
jgi:gamma-D-glutamyl-L-lysine dipeptidyl-peptidase